MHSSRFNAIFSMFEHCYWAFGCHEKTDIYMKNTKVFIYLSYVCVCIIFYTLSAFVMLSICDYAEICNTQNTCSWLPLQITVYVPTNCLDVFIYTSLYKIQPGTACDIAA